MEMIPSDYKPWGGLAGMYAGEQAAQANTMNDLGIMRSGLENIVKQKEAAFAQDEMNSQDLRDARLSGMIGENKSKQAKGYVDMETSLSDAKAKIAKNMTEEHASNITRTVSQLDEVIAIGKANGPAGIAMVDQYVSGMSEGSKQIWEKAKAANPQNPLSGLENLSNTLKTMLADSVSLRSEKDKATHQGGIDLTKEGVKGMFDLAKQKLANQGHIAAAGAKTGMERSAEQLMELRRIAEGLPPPKTGPNAGVSKEQARAIIKGISTDAQDKASASARARGEAQENLINQLLGKGVKRETIKSNPDGSVQYTDPNTGRPTKEYPESKATVGPNGVIKLD